VGFLNGSVGWFVGMVLSQEVREII
jgi:hypothetical protein